MKRISSRLIALIAFVVFWVAAVPVAGAAQWQLDASVSSLTYLSMKVSGERSIYEVNRFNSFDGGVDASGVRIGIDLASLDTLVPIRNERVLAHVFKAAQFPRAQITGAGVSVPEVGDATEREVEVRLEMGGRAETVKGRISVTRPRGDTVVVQAVEPVLIDAKRWAMADGFEVLREMVKLAHIATTIPVSFRFVFRKK